MAKSNPKSVQDVMAEMQTVKAGDPDMIAKLNEIALKVAAAQGKKPASASGNMDIAADPMDELGCEGCQ